MYKNIRTFVKPDVRIADLIFENPYLLLLLEHFDLNMVMHDKTVSQICSDNGIDEKVFISFANLYNGFPLSGNEVFDNEQIKTIIRFLSNSHHYFKHDKYPELQGYIKKIFEKNPSAEIRMIGKFFDEYFLEVTEHLDYEENVAFPYFLSLLKSGTTEHKKMDNKFSGTEFLEHHTDIESKLTDLKNLLIRHVSLKNDPENRRKLLFSLIELEYVLYIHSLIEESILVPLVIELEKNHKLD
jgi:regulator of cell morphogenesis and NO signaling